MRKVFELCLKVELLRFKLIRTFYVLLKLNNQRTGTLSPIPSLKGVSFLQSGECRRILKIKFSLLQNKYANINTSDRSQMNPKNFFYITAFSAQLPYIAGRSLPLMLVKYVSLLKT